MNKENTIDEDDFNRLLEWLNPDRNAASAKYLALRRSLVKFFTCRGCFEADPALYFYGVARNVYNEWLRKHRPPPDPPPAPERDDLALDCLDECLARLPVESRTLVVEYYRDEGGAKIKSRKSQARSLGITVNALRIKACHVRASLRGCIAECVGRAAA
jgi:DNA-directed RNA polymerase specialized sigma24 family protein